MVESMSDSDTLDEEGGGPSTEGRRVGPLSDYFEEGGAEFYPANTEARLKQVMSETDPSKAVHVGKERESLEAQRDKIDQLIAEEQGTEATLTGVRQDLGIPASGKSERLEKLEESKEKLNEKEEKLNIAEEYNDVL